MGKPEIELQSLGFQQNTRSNWSRKHDIVQIVRSSESHRFRVTWREEWKDYLAIIFDYSEAGGPVCVVPTQVLFNSTFVSQKRNEQSYVNSGNYWSQLFNFDDDLPQMVLSYENRWDVIGGKRGPIEVGQIFSKRTVTTKSRSRRQRKKPPAIPVEKGPDFGGLLKAITEDKQLLHLYCDLMEELRQRGIVRSGNNPISDYGENIIGKRLNLKLTAGSNKGYDAIDEKTQVKFQIKSRRTTKYNDSRQLGVIRNLDQRLFDYLIAVFFDEFLEPKEIWQIPVDIISRYAKFSKHQNGHILILAGDILEDEDVKKLL
jgi:hypothetical protein